MIKQVYSSSINYFQVMDELGEVDQSIFPSDLNDDKILQMYKYMLLTRAVDAKTLSLQRQGRADTYAPSMGEEATQIGTAFALRPQDMVVPSFRQHGTYIVRGLPLEVFFLYWKGFEDGCVIPKEVNATPYIVPVSSQMPHAAGIAFAFKYKKLDAVALGFVGDGGTSEGDFYESLNFAGVWGAPLVAIIENNQWAISVPRSKQSAAQTLAQKGIAGGVACVQVDGNDAVAVYKATKEAIANSPKGPTLIECVTYRLSMHTTSDDPTKYRSDDEVEEWKRKDPLIRMNYYLTRKGLMTPELEEKWKQEHIKIIDEAVEKAEQIKADPKNMFEHVYSFMPEYLKEELEAGISNNFWQPPSNE